MNYLTLIGICWAVFIVYWGISALSAKRTLRSNYIPSLLVRFAAMLILIGFLYFSGIRVNTAYHPNDLIGWIGLLFAASGIGFAIWARMHLASNWGMPMSVKENPELVATGPYAYVRHPIYTGILLAMAGSALVGGIFWAVILVVGIAYFIYAALQEERLMLEEFPDQYPAYKARTKMLIPFIV